jgi:small conductance mechanosensitive channel
MFMVTQDGADTAGQAAADTTTQAAETAGAMSISDLDSDMLLDLFNTYGIPLIKALVLLILTLVVAGMVRKMVIKVTSKAKVEVTLCKFFGNMAKWAVMVLGVVTIMGIIGIETTSFAAVIAAVGFAIGMAMSGTIGNVASGVLLLVFRPFKVGDVVNAAGITAKVDEIGLFTTTFDTPDNRHIIVPNGAIFGATIENITHHSTRRVDVAVGAAYDADIDKTKEVLERVANSVEGGLKDPAPVVYLVELGASSVDYSIRVWAATADYWAVRERITREVKYALDAAGIGIPFPQRDLHVPAGIEVTVKNG